MMITSCLFEAYLRCPTKCWLQSQGETGENNSYSAWMRNQNKTYHSEGIGRLVEGLPQNERVIGVSIPENLKSARWRLAADLLIQTPSLESRLHAVERVPSEGQGKPAQFIPIRFVFTNKLSKDDRLLLVFDAMVFSEVLGREVSLARIIHGDNHATLKVKTSGMMGEVRNRIEKMRALLSSSSLPDLVLNRHCTECEFHARCRQKAMEKDDLSLLANMTEKERKKYHSKGIFTVTQLSYTFRPRRRSKRMRDKRERYHHSLKALAIREKKIHIVGNPELKIDGTPVYLDVEGLPDRDFYYLIGLRIGNGASAVEHSLWADTVEDERKIWREFLGILESVEKPVLIHYGSYESTFIKQMSERYGEAPDGSPAAKATQTPVNLLSVMFAQIYFPMYSNGLKDVADWLGFKWSDFGASGIQAILWRQDWERSVDPAKKQQLITYNSEDCAACELVARTINRSCAGKAGVNSEGGTTQEIAFEDVVASQQTMWPKFASPIEAFEVINKAARWDYQRDRIYVRTGPRLGAIRSARKRPSRIEGRVNKEVTCQRPLVCPHCGRRLTEAAHTATRILWDVRFGRFGVRRYLVKYHIRHYRCQFCHICVGRPKEFWQQTKIGRNVVALIIFKTIDLCIPQRTVPQDMNRLFGFHLHEGDIRRLKASAAKFYNETRQAILTEMVKGTLIHADETRIQLKSKPAYVWVFASFREVVYFYAESREGDLPQRLLKDFQGVLVTDFYAAYDSIECPQQRCLIHLMRDLNDAILDSPYDQELRGIVTAFAELLKMIVQTIDLRGLKRHFLRKHRVDVGRFYRQISRTNYESEAASKCRERLEKNRDKLFTFLDYDGVPWNNNNVEHAIKAFARLRRTIDGLSTPKGIEEYCILLSICQTCKYMGVDFLDFLRSGEKDLHAFAASRAGRRRQSVNEQYCADGTIRAEVGGR